MIELGRLVTYGNRMQVALTLPDMLGEVKAGDRVALQVLYVPGGIVSFRATAFRVKCGSPVYRGTGREHAVAEQSPGNRGLASAMVTRNSAASKRHASPIDQRYWDGPLRL